MIYQTNKNNLKLNNMNYFTVTYTGRNTRFASFKDSVLADSKRDAVENVYSKFLNDNYFPQDDGTINDCDGNQIATADDDRIEYDGGYFEAELETE